MRFGVSILAGFITLGIATPGLPLYKSVPTKSSRHTQATEPVPIDGDWSIGCDEDNYCSYYHVSAAATDIAALKSRGESTADDGLAPPGQNVSVSTDSHSLFGRHAAFTGDQCQSCDNSNCPDCYGDCPGCQHFICVDAASHLSMCMSIRPKLLPPCYDNLPPIEIETTTVHVVAVTVPPERRTPAAEPTLPSLPTSASAPTSRGLSTVKTIPIPVPLPSIFTVTSVVTKTVTELIPRPLKSTSTVLVQVTPIITTSTWTTTVTFSSLATAVTFTAPSPWSTTVTLPRPSRSSSTPTIKPIVLATRNTPLASRIPAATSSAALPRTMPNTARATPGSAPLSLQHGGAPENSGCKLCEAPADCESCAFSCDDCVRLSCQNAFSDSEICIEVSDDPDTDGAVANSTVASDVVHGRAGAMFMPQDEEDGTASLAAPRASECIVCNRKNRSCRLVEVAMQLEDHVHNPWREWT
ncbi:hypothetical protein ACJBU6_06533 [Exserohilum turcicum]